MTTTNATTTNATTNPGASQPDATSNASSLPPTMRAIVHTRYGAPRDVLALDQTEVPTPGDGQVLIRVAASAIDRGVWHLVYGHPYIARAMFGLRRPKVTVPGFDVAGVVVAVGADVGDLAVGDRVTGFGIGAFAEYALADASKLAIVPDAVDLDRAAAVPASGMTALQAVREHAKVQPGERVLVTGASGGVGSYAVQIAVADGAEVIGVCSGAKAEFVRNLGAVDTIDYRTTDDLGGDYDVIIDTGGNRRLRDLRRALRPDGRLVIVGGDQVGAARSRWTGGVERSMLAVLWSPFVSQQLTMFISPERGDDVATLLDLVADGTVRVPVDRTVGLDEVIDTIEALERGEISGKAVVTI